MLAYGTAEGGGDWQVWRLRDVATGKDLPDELAHIKYYRPVIVPGGVYYSRFPAPPPGNELTVSRPRLQGLLPRLGTDVAPTRVVYERPDQPTWQFELATTDDGRYLVISIGDGQVGDSGMEQIVLYDIAHGDVRTVHRGHFDDEYVFLGNRPDALLPDHHRRAEEAHHRDRHATPAATLEGDRARGANALDDAASSATSSS